MTHPQKAETYLSSLVAGAALPLEVAAPLAPAAGAPLALAG
jgi:hypothetical protein